MRSRRARTRKVRGALLNSTTPFALSDYAPAKLVRFRTSDLTVNLICDPFKGNKKHQPLKLAVGKTGPNSRKTRESTCNCSSADTLFDKLRGRRQSFLLVELLQHLKAFLEMRSGFPSVLLMPVSFPLHQILPLASSLSRDFVPDPASATTPRSRARPQGSRRGARHTPPNQFSPPTYHCCFSRLSFRSVGCVLCYPPPAQTSLPRHPANSRLDQPSVERCIYSHTSRCRRHG
jgi:hypothetical protein